MCESKHNDHMFKRLIHPSAYDADIPGFAPIKGLPSSPQNKFLRAPLKYILAVNFLINLLVMSVLIYSVIEHGERFQMQKQELLVMQEQIKKLRHLMQETTERKPSQSSPSESDHPLIEDIPEPTHLKYMGLFKFGDLQKALIETEQGGILFTHNQMVDQQWRLKKIHQDRLVLESKYGQQVTIYKEPSDE